MFFDVINLYCKLNSIKLLGTFEDIPISGKCCIFVFDDLLA